MEVTYEEVSLSPSSCHLLLQFPKSCCTSVNEVICHGIPDMRPLQNGDICNVDVTVYHRGYHGDLNETLLVGDAVSDEAKRLVTNTWECLEKAIQEVRPGMKYRDVGNVIQKHAQTGGFSVVRSYCGHGMHGLGGLLEEMFLAGGVVLTVFRVLVHWVSPF